MDARVHELLLEVPYEEMSVFFLILDEWGKKCKMEEDTHHSQNPKNSFWSLFRYIVLLYNAKKGAGVAIY